MKCRKLGAERSVAGFAGENVTRVDITDSKWKSNLTGRGDGEEVVEKAEGCVAGSSAG